MAPAKKKANAKKTGTKKKTAAKKKMAASKKKTAPAKGSKKSTPTSEDAPVMHEGASAFEEKGRADERTERQKSRRAKRVWLAPDSDAVLIFADSRAVGVYEHNFRNPQTGKFNGFVTCVGERRPCPACAAGNVPKYTVYFTVIDTTEFEFEGKTYKNRKLLYGAKNVAIKKLKKLLDKHGGNLTGLAVRVTRYSKDDVNCGSDFDVVSSRRVDIAKKLGEEAAQPIKYEEVLALPTDEEFAAYGFRPMDKPVGSGGAGFNEEAYDNDSGSEEEGGDTVDDDVLADLLG